MKVFFAVPSYSGIRDELFFNSLENTVKYCEANGVKTGLSILQGCCYIQMSRIKLVHEFMKSNADKLFFLDDDIEWDSKDALKLINMKDEFVCGVYPYKKPFEDYPIVINVTDDTRPKVREDGCISAVCVPTGFMCITRSVIEKLMAAYPEKKFVDKMGTDDFIELYDLFPQGVDGGRWVGEDYAFCRLWTRIGGEIWLVPDITFNHHDRVKNENHTGNYHKFLLNCPQPEAA